MNINYFATMKCPKCACDECGWEGLVSDFTIEELY